MYLSEHNLTSLLQLHTITGRLYSSTHHIDIVIGEKWDGSIHQLTI